MNRLECKALGWAARGALVIVVAACSPAPEGLEEDTGGERSPVFEPDRNWPPPFPEGWVMRLGTDVHVDPQDHVWILHRPSLISEDDISERQQASEGECCTIAPALIELAPDSGVIQAWGAMNAPEEWPPLAHGVFVDHNDFVWIATTEYHQVVKFSRDGNRILEIGEFGMAGTDDDHDLLGAPADVYVDPETNEVFVADGYDNSRVVVYEGETGSYLRHWGAYGTGSGDQVDSSPSGGSDVPPTAFRIVHGLTGSGDGLLYVADRSNSRVQVFRKDGEFVEERILRSGAGGAFDVALSSDPEQEFLYVADGTEHRIWILRRNGLDVLGYFGSEGTEPGQITRPHKLSTDSRGNIYVAESTPGRRVQRFLFKGLEP